MLMITSLSTVFALTRFSALLLLAPLSASAFTTLSILDDFQSGSHDLNLTGTTDTLSDVATGGGTIVGGRRSIEFSVTTNPLGSQARTSVNAAASGLLDLDLGPDAIGYTRLRYEGASGAGLGGLNFTEGGHDSIILRVSFLDQVLDIGFTVTDINTRIATFNTTISSPITGMSTHSFAFSDFANGAGIDFSQVDKLSIELSANQPDTRAVIESVSLGNAPAALVPEPDRAILLSIAFITHMARRWRPPIRPSTLA
jgi:hypothetical protein